MQKLIFSIFIFSLTFGQNSVVRQFSKAFADVAEKAKPAVVTIITDKVVSLNQFDDFGYFFFQPNMPRQREYKTNALGSGVIVDAKKGSQPDESCFAVPWRPDADEVLVNAYLNFWPSIADFSMKAPEALTQMMTKKFPCDS